MNLNHKMSLSPGLALTSQSEGIISQVKLPFSDRKQSLADYRSKRDTSVIKTSFDYLRPDSAVRQDGNIYIAPS